MDRRQFLKFLGLAPLSLLAACDMEQLGQAYDASSLKFKPVEATNLDELVLPKGYSYQIIRSWGDSIGWEQKFGFNNDFTSFFRLDDKHALLWVNHESVNPKYIKSEAEQRKSVGGSIIVIESDEEGKWTYCEDKALQEKYNRRIDAGTPFKLTGPVSKKHKLVKGTLANCSGGQTPWGTVLSCEENFDHFKSKYHWKNFNLKHYGWVVEVDPYNPDFAPRKHTALGRFAHENASLTVSPSGYVVIYMGDDSAGEHIYKFVSKNPLPANIAKLARENLSYKSGSIKTNIRQELSKLGLDAESGSKYLNEGSLYVARMLSPDRGVWRLLDVRDDRLKKKFKSQAELLINTRQAAKVVEATPLDRPEDIEVSPYDGSIFVALTENYSRANYHGAILKINEDDNNAESQTFSYSSFLMGGPPSFLRRDVSKTGLSCPDNLAFDNAGNLWVCTDIKSMMLNKIPYMYHGNNSLFMVPLVGKNAGKPIRFASAPKGAELTGISFSDDYKTLFLSIQHPGEASKSTWPHRDEVARPSVVSIKLI